MTIDVKAQMALLKKLQDVDIHVIEIDEELSNFPNQIKEAKAEWSAVLEQLNALEAEKAASETEKRDLDGDLEASVAHLREREEKLYAIKTNKEYQAALKEISDGRQANKQREEKILELMEKIDGLDKETTQLSEQSAEKEKEFRAAEEELMQKKSELEKEKAALVIEVDKVGKDIDKALLEKYRVIQQGCSDPVAPVVKGVCQGCYMNIPPQMFIELLKGVKIHFCPNCYRFIIIPEESDTSSNEDGANEN